MNIKDRIKIFLKSQKSTVKSFEEAINVSNGYVNSINKSIGADKLEQILELYPNLNIDWLLFGKGEMIISENRSLNMVSEPESEYGNKNLIPVYDIYATAGANHGAVTDHPSEFIDPGDLFRDADALIRVYGDSMGAGYQSGSFVPIKKLKNKMLTVPGLDYVIETSEYRVLKNIRKSKKENHILACSLNIEVFENGELSGQLIHEPFDISLNDIISISMAVGNVRRNQITTINGKY